jgi:hypothetical protein
MSLLNPKTILIRVLIIAILAAFVYPFLPAKQQWQIQAAFGSSEADSLLGEFYQPPLDGALQFAMEFPFKIGTDRRPIISRNDIRYVELGDKLWGRGQLWVIHLRLNALTELEDQIRSSPGEPLWVELDRDWRVPLDVARAQSPLYIDPAGFSSDPSFARSVLEDWYPPMGF